MVLRGRRSCGPRGRGPSRAGQCRRMPTVERCPGGAQSSAPEIVADGGDTVPPRPVGARRGTGRLSRATGSARASGSAFSCGPRGRGPSQGDPVGGAQSSVPGIVADGGDAVPRRPDGARKGTRPLGRVEGLARAPGVCLSLRTAGTWSLPWDPVGGAQSSAPAIFPDRGDVVPPGLANAAGCLRFATAREGNSLPGPRFYIGREDTVPLFPASAHPRGRGAVPGDRNARGLLVGVRPTAMLRFPSWRFGQ
jgi:hypothetical protein